jgi:hypothetical protein
VFLSLLCFLCACLVPIFQVPPPPNKQKPAAVEKDSQFDDNMYNRTPSGAVQVPRTPIKKRLRARNNDHDEDVPMSDEDEENNTNTAKTPPLAATAAKGPKAKMGKQKRAKIIKQRRGKGDSDWPEFNEEDAPKTISLASGWVPSPECYPLRKGVEKFVHIPPMIAGPSPFHQYYAQFNVSGGSENSE